MSFSQDQSKILEILRKNGINSLWHFTDIKNLPHIRELGGLRSKEYLERKGYWGRNILFPGGDNISQNIDRKLGNWDKISLNFKPYTPLTYIKKREKHLAFIEIDPEVAACENVYFADCNAARTRNKQKRGKGMKGLSYVRFDIISGPPELRNQDWHKYVQAEVLVPHHIPISMFKAIHFISNASREYGESLWTKRCDLFCVNPETFYDINRQGKGSIQFPYVKEVFISTKEVSKEKIHRIRTNAYYIVQGKPFWVIVYLYAIPGSRVSISISSIGAVRERKEEEAEKIIDGIFYQQFITPKSSRGLDVKVYIDKILWSQRRIHCKEMR